MSISFVTIDRFLELFNKKFGKKNVTNIGAINANAPKANLGLGAVITQIIK